MCFLLTTEDATIGIHVTILSDLPELKCTRKDGRGSFFLPELASPQTEV